MQAHVINDVKQAAGLVVALYWVEKIHVGSISSDVVTCVNLYWYKCSFDTQTDTSFLVKLTHAFC
jgi:hypothetical protein